MYDLIRVRAGGREFNAGRARAAVQGFEVLDEPTHDLAGALRPSTRLNGRPIKPRTSVDAEVAKKKSPAATRAADQEAAAATAPSNAITNPPSSIKENES